MILANSLHIITVSLPPAKNGSFGIRTKTMPFEALVRNCSVWTAYPSSIIHFCRNTNSGADAHLHKSKLWITN